MPDRKYSKGPENPKETHRKHTKEEYNAYKQFIYYFFEEYECALCKGSGVMPKPDETNDLKLELED